MTIEDVAKYLKMTPQTIYSWAQTGKIPAVKLGKEWRFRKEWVDNWFNQHIAEQFKPLVTPNPKNNNDDKVG